MTTDPRPPRAQLLITLTQDGDVSLQATVQDKILCLGLLDIARQSLHDASKQEERLVQPVAGVIRPRG